MCIYCEAFMQIDVRISQNSDEKKQPNLKPLKLIGYSVIRFGCKPLRRATIQD